MEPFLDYKNAAQYLNVPIGTLYALVSLKKIPHVRVSKRIVRFEVAALQSWLREHSVSARGAE